MLRCVAAIAGMREGDASGRCSHRVNHAHPGQGYARIVSGREGPPPVEDGFDGADAGVERESAWLDVPPECDRRLFAEEMSQLLAEAAETDDFADCHRGARLCLHVPSRLGGWAKARSGGPSCSTSPQACGPAPK